MQNTQKGVALVGLLLISDLFGCASPGVEQPGPAPGPSPAPETGPPDAVTPPPSSPGEKCSFASPHPLASRDRSADQDPRPVCERSPAYATLQPDGTYRCRGLPFEVRLPQGLRAEQYWGNGWMSLQVGVEGGMIAIAYRPQRWALNRNEWSETDVYTQNFLQALKPTYLKVETPRDIEIAGADHARAADFGIGPLEGTSLSVVARGWFINIMAGGGRSRELHRDSVAAKAFLESLRILPVSPPVTHRFDSEASVELPSEAWLLGEDKRPGIVRETRYYVPATGDLLSVAEGRAAKPCRDLTEADWLEVAGDITVQQTDQQIRFVRNHWLLVGETRILLSEAEARSAQGAQQNLSFQPGIGALACRDQHFFQLFALRDRPGPRPLRDEVEAIFASLR